jgi:hypothetical protein
MAQTGETITHAELEARSNRLAHFYEAFPWILPIHDGVFSLPTCPGGCQHELSEIPEKLQAKLEELANNPD